MGKERAASAPYIVAAADRLNFSYCGLYLSLFISICGGYVLVFAVLPIIATKHVYQLRQSNVDWLNESRMDSRHLDMGCMHTRARSRGCRETSSHSGPLRDSKEAQLDQAGLVAGLSNSQQSHVLKRKFFERVAGSNLKLRTWTGYDKTLGAVSALSTSRPWPSHRLVAVREKHTHTPTGVSTHARS